MIGAIVLIVLTSPWGRLSELELISLNVSPTQVAPGETVTVTMEVRNAGTERERFPLELAIDGVVEQYKYPSLDAGETRSILFFVKKDTEGSYSVGWPPLTRTFVVVEPEPPPD